MSIFFLKSLLSLVLAVSALIAMYTMFEVFGRNGAEKSREKMKKFHRLNGIFYFLIFAFVSYYCLSFIAVTKAELSTRSTFHSIFALYILVLMGLKISYIKVYRQFYNQTKVIGLVMALLTLGVAATSGGYYLLVSGFGTDVSFDKLMQYKMKLTKNRVEKTDEKITFTIKTDPESVGKGKNIFDSKCKFCHDAYSSETIVGPGLQGIMKKKRLPVSERPATPENIILQLKEPFSRMPSFEYLTEEETSDIIAFLNTL
jgi:hypothetical protein